LIQATKKIVGEEGRGRPKGDPEEGREKEGRREQ